LKLPFRVGVEKKDKEVGEKALTSRKVAQTIATMARIREKWQAT